MTQIPILRSKQLILNSAGFNIVGRIGHDLCKDQALWDNIDKYVDKLALIDWSKENEMWKGNIVAEGSKGLKIANSNKTLKDAVEKVKVEIGLLTKVEENLLQLA